MEKQSLFYIEIKMSATKAQLQALSDSGEIEILPIDYVPEWQRQETARRFAYRKQHPESVLSLEAFQEILLQENED